MNGGFEEENICTEYIKNCAPEGWISNSLRSNYYFDDVKNAYEGQHFTGLVFTSKPMPHFLRSRLLCGLRKDAEYHLEFFIRSFQSIDSIGIYFSQDDILYRKQDIRKTSPQLWIKNGIHAKEKNDWQKVELKYRASGDENFISIGNFKKSETVLSGLPDLGKDFYYFLDNVKLTPLNLNEKNCEGSELIREEEYAMDARHNMLERMVYIYSKNPPEIVPAPKTKIIRIDTLVIPDVLFATNSFALNQKAGYLLDSFTTKIRHITIDSIVVEGHTDSTGNVSSNQKLSFNRANSVADFLKKSTQAYFSIRGLASEKPVADNRSAAGRQRNRRVEIYFYVRE